MDLPPGVVYPGSGVPQQRGTVYGGVAGPLEAGDMTMAVPGYSPAENTGSLTGHILASGWADTPQETKDDNRRVVIVLTVVLLVLLGVSVAVLVMVNDFLSGLLGGVVGG
jgi:hypothetical protein